MRLHGIMPLPTSSRASVSKLVQSESREPCSHGFYAEPQPNLGDSQHKARRDRHPAFPSLPWSRIKTSFICCFFIKKSLILRHLIQIRVRYDILESVWLYSMHWWNRYNHQTKNLHKRNRQERSPLGWIIRHCIWAKRVSCLKVFLCLYARGCSEPTNGRTRNKTMRLTLSFMPDWT